MRGRCGFSERKRQDVADRHAQFLSVDLKLQLLRRNVTSVTIDMAGRRRLLSCHDGVVSGLARAKECRFLRFPRFPP